MRRKHRAFIETSRNAYDRRVRSKAELYCLVRGHQWAQVGAEHLTFAKIRYTDKCRHCGRTRIEIVREH